ncbi:MAG: hypothetical protein RSE47_06120 [Acidaminococcaceae bacterium]
MWKVVYIAPSQEAAQKIQELLGANGFLIQINNVNPKHKGHGSSFEISVPLSEAEEAYEILCENRFQG